MMKIRILPAIVLLPILAGCAANLSSDKPIDKGDGTFTIAVAINTDFGYTSFRTINIQRIPDEERVGQRVFSIDLKQVHEDNESLLAAYGELQPGSYRFLSLEQPVAGGTYFVELPKEMRITIQAGKNVDLGTLIYNLDLAKPVADNHFNFAYGWIPSTPEVKSAMQAQLMRQNPGLETVQQSPWPASSDAEEHIITAFALNNPAPNSKIVKGADGELLVPAHLGRIIERDTDGQWHVLDTGSLGTVAEAASLKDGRILALVQNGALKLSNAAHTQWQTIMASTQDVPVMYAGVLGDGRIYALVYKDHPVKEKHNKIEMESGSNLYVTDPDKIDWKMVQQLDDEGYASSDDVYLYGYLDDGEIYATNYRTGKKIKSKIPDNVGTMNTEGNGRLLLNVPSPNFFGAEFPEYLSTDAGATWTRLPDTWDNKMFIRTSYLMREASGAYLFSAEYSKKVSPPAGAARSGYYETGNNGKTWKFAFPKFSNSNCLADQSRIYFENKFWTLCESGEIWSFDPVTNNVVKERALVTALSKPNG
ncbi:MAG: hypothetical protein ACRETO_07740 [Gammaproteobacteria bacterium]